MLQQTMLDRSWRVFILEEHDRRLVEKDAAPDETRWDDVPVVLDRIRRLPFEVVAAKPLVESDRAASLLDATDNASGVWMLRHYRKRRAVQPPTLRPRQRPPGPRALRV